MAKVRFMKKICNWCGEKFTHGYDDQYCCEGCHIKYNDNLDLTSGISSKEIDVSKYYDDLKKYYTDKE